MKAARRQELKTNDLSIYIQDVTEYLRKNATKVTVFIILIVALVAAVLYRVHTSTQTLTNGWNAYLAAARITPNEDDPNWVDDTIERWEQIIATYDDPSIRSSSIWALVGFSRRQAESAADPVVQKKLLETGARNCDRIISEYQNIVTLYGSALIERALIEQDLFVLDNDEAHKDRCRAYFERVLNEDVFLGSPLRSEVRSRLDQFDGMWTVLALTEPPIASENMEGPVDLPDSLPVPHTGESQQDSDEMSSEATSEPVDPGEPQPGDTEPDDEEQSPDDEEQSPDERR